MRLDSDHSPLYTFYNMNGLGWEPRQKVDCISSGYFYPVFVIISTRDIPISVSGDESGNILLSLEHIHSGIIAGVTIFTRCNVLMLTGCSCSLFPGQCWWHGPGSWQGVMTVSRKCEDVMLSRIRPTPVMMSARVTTLHPLVTFANTSTYMMRQDTPSFSPQIFISECVSNRFLLLLAGKMFVWTTVFLFTLYLSC